MKIGYIRVSTQEQNTIRQEVMMKELGVEELYLDKASCPPTAFQVSKRITSPFGRNCHWIPMPTRKNLLAKKSERSVIALPTILRRSKQKRA